MSSQPFYMISLEEAKQLYQQGCITARGLLLIYLKIRLPAGKGWSFKQSARNLSEELGFSVKTLYKLLKNLPAGFRFWVNPDTEFYFSHESPSGDSQSPSGDSQSPSGDSQSPSGDSQSPSGENERLETLSGEASSEPLDSYKLFLDSLSDCEREKFLGFVETETRSLKIACLADWLAAKDASGQHRYLGFWQKYTRPAPAPQGPAPMPAAAPEPEPVDPEETRRALAKAKEEYPWLFRKTKSDERGSGRRGGFVPGVQAIGDAIGGLLDGLGGDGLGGGGMEAAT